MVHQGLIPPCERRVDLPAVGAARPVPYGVRPAAHACVLEPVGPGLMLLQADVVLLPELQPVGGCQAGSSINPHWPDLVMLHDNTVTPRIEIE